MVVATTRGYDSFSSCGGITADLLAAGASFVCRYYGGSRGKDLTLPEAQSLSRAGLDLVAVYENSPYRMDQSSGYFTAAQADTDARAAFAGAQSIGQPGGSAIYFAVDADFAPQNITRWIIPYFQQVSDRLGACATEAAVAPYVIGVYGSGDVCGAVLSTGLAAYTWLSQSPQWHGTEGYVGASIVQGAKLMVGGISVDANMGTTSIGSFRVP